MFDRTRIKDLIENSETYLNKTITLAGWIKTIRDQKQFLFIELNDGSHFNNFQILVDSSTPNYEKIKELTTGASISAKGNIVKSPGKNQAVEMQAKEITIFGLCDALSYPLQKKRHSFEFLREIAHLRPRTNTQGAVARVRNALSYATHKFFQEKGFMYVQTPIITASDCEGGGELFRVTTLDDNDPPRTENGQIDYSKDFFAKPSYLTVSGQLNAEIYALAFSDVYTFGPTFRAENSHTARHLAEFWMIEPEIAFADLTDDMNNAEEYLKYLAEYVLKHCQRDLQFFDQFIEKGLIQRLEQVLKDPFERLPYTKAIEILEKSEKKFEFPTKWGSDLQTEHERYLAEEYFNKPVIITDYPASIKAFYMRSNDDGKTVAAMDVLVPKIGEIIGGSQREERYDVLEEKILSVGLNKEDYWWYLELRKYGSVPHAGYGVGFERLVQFFTGMENIRDVIAFPRHVGHADF